MSRRRSERKRLLEAGDPLPSDLTIRIGGPAPPALLAECGLAPHGARAPLDMTLQSKGSFGDSTCFLVVGKRALAGPSLGTAKEAVFELVMAQLDAQPWWRRLQRADRAARALLWPTVSSSEALRRQARISILSAR